MKKLFFGLILSTLSVLACPNGGICKPQMNNTCHENYKSTSLLGTLYYVLKKMNKIDDADIKLAIHSYKMDIAGMKRGINPQAFKEGKFDKDLYREKSRSRLKLQAQVDLFETIYLVFNNEEKKSFYTLMTKYQEQLKTEGTMNVKPCPNIGMVPAMCPSKVQGCLQCKNKCQCENEKECQCKEDCTCPKCKEKRSN